ncbi:hypothetical protein BOX15_Mlig005802g2, partial [Macrostomum lignano]
NVKLLSSDNEIIELDSDALRLSERLRRLADYPGGDGHEIPVPNVTSATLRRVATWCAHHRDDPAPPEDDENRLQLGSVASGVYGSGGGGAVFSVWDSEFLNLEPVCLFELLQAAAYLDVRGLVDACCLAVADMIRGRGPEDIRKTFNIKCDLTPQEEEQVRQELAWCHDPPEEKSSDSLPD